MGAPARTLAACVLVTAVACTFDRQVIGVPVSQVVVHGVLDPRDTLVDVLIERSLSGAITVPKVPYDPLDPINSAGGVPARGAQVSITGPDGTVPGFEVRYPFKSATYGAGRYVFRRLIVRPGGHYTLNIRTADSIVVTGSTIVPNFAPDPGASVPIRFPGLARDHDTLSLSWAAVPTARSYGLRINSPFGAFQLFTDSTRLHIAGDLRNVFASGLPRVFIPGFEQDYIVYAADTNFFDYYRSRNDPFTGSGIINRLEGGIGLFGSTVGIDWLYVDVTQATIEPTFEGIYDLVQGSFLTRNLIDMMRLYIETPASATVSASLSGWYHNPSASSRDGVLGKRDGTHVELRFLLNQNADQRMGTFIGTQSHDSLFGTFSLPSGMSEQVAFRKRATP